MAFSKEIVLMIGGTEFAFRVETSDYNKYINDLKPDNKITPSVNFIRATLMDKTRRPELDEICDQGLAVDIAGMLIEEFRPKLEIAVKK